jgi:hypothetical protein
MVGALAWLAGFCLSGIRRRPRLLPPDLVQHVRQEQVQRLRKIFGLR